MTRSVSRRGGRRMTSSGGGSMPSASAGALSVSRLIQRICVASSGTAIASPVSSSPITPGEHDAEEHREHLADVRREQEAQELADVREDPAALADGADDRGEVVVGEDHVRRLLGDVGAGDAHRDADVRRLQRGRVVDAVAGHRDDPPVRLERVDDAQLVLRRDAGVDGDLPHRGRARLVVERLELAAGDDARAGRGDAEVGGDPRRGVRVVAGDHQHAHAGGVRLGDRRPRLRARRVDDPDQPEVDELALDRLVLRRPLAGRQRPVGDGQRAQREVGEPLDGREDLAPAGVRQRPHVAARPAPRCSARAARRARPW